VGLTLPSGWVVTEKIQRLANATGGQFSCGYKVQRDGGIAFLKALDYSKAQEIALSAGIDTLTALQGLINATNSNGISCRIVSKSGWIA
jgi:hypothetical protein